MRLDFDRRLAPLPKCAASFLYELVQGGSQNNDSGRERKEAGCGPEALDFPLHEGMASAGIARAYDSFYPELTKEERADWKKLMKRCLNLYLESARRNSWTVTTIVNANALALIDEAPELAQEVLGYVCDLWRWLNYCQGPDGGNTGGAQYWHYATFR